MVYSEIVENPNYSLLCVYSGSRFEADLVDSRINLQTTWDCLIGPPKGCVIAYSRGHLIVYSI